MKGNELLDLIGGIDAAMVEAADQPSIRKKEYMVRWIAVSACLVLIVAVAAWWSARAHLNHDHEGWGKNERSALTVEKDESGWGKETAKRTEANSSEDSSDPNTAGAPVLLAEGRHIIGETDLIRLTVTDAQKRGEKFVFTVEIENKSDMALSLTLHHLSVNGINLLFINTCDLAAGATTVETAEVPLQPVLEKYDMVPETIHQMQWMVSVSAEESGETEDELFTYIVDDYERQLADVNSAACLLEADEYKIYVMDSYLLNNDFCMDLYVVNELDAQLVVDILQMEVNGVTYQLAFGVDLFPYGQTMVTLRLYEKELAKIGLDAETIDKAVFYLTIIKMTNGMQEWYYEAEWNK